MNFLVFLLSLFFTNYVLSDVVVTVTHPVAVTVTFDPSLGRVIIPSGVVVDDNGESGSKDVYEDDNGKVNAKATSSNTKSKSTMMFSTYSKTASTLPTDATTDVNSAFRMSLPFAFGTAAAIILVAIVF